MGKEYYNVVAFFMAMMVFLIVGANAVDNSLKAQQNRCNDYCFRACVFPSKFCRWWCGGRCQNPIGFDSYKLTDLDEGKGSYPVPTEEDYRRYSETHKS
ncbi:uncharacterized protein LOC107616108 [Arachis ipaensis]|uniref:Uncharacterized protein n=1 Tax=Arachis hypogaea TaxID=3818 RepID=N1NKI0_ARAHY|nr:uncharacterized protein LOC107616108 [Arachis ipaensis]RYQ93928.1 hypothetical protein Ahy_B09g100145 isoform A [Arachis hypogaea]CCW28825.1 hypothetical protein ARAX_AHF417E07-016 [Arachis hypogaea]